MSAANAGRERRGPAFYFIAERHGPDRFGAFADGLNRLSAFRRQAPIASRPSRDTSRSANTLAGPFACFAD
jgi:hypothetical protein